MDRVPRHWRWVVLVSATLCHVISGGVIFSFGVIYTDLRDRLRTTGAQTSAVAAIALTIACFVAPVTKLLCKKLGCRVMTVIGALVMAGGLFLCCFAPTLHYLYAFFGVLAGGGYGIVVVATLLVTKQYFKDNQSVVLFILAMGQPFGVFILPLLTRLLLDMFSYFGTYLILSGILLNIVLLGLLLRPLPANETSSLVGEYTRMDVGHPDATSPTKNVDEENPVSVDRSEAIIERTERETLTPKSKSSYRSVEGPSETIIVSTSDKSWKFDGTALYESDDEDSASNDEKETVEPVKQHALHVQAYPVADIAPVVQENQTEQPETHTLFEIVMGITTPKMLCDCRILWLTLSAILYSFGVGYPYFFYPDVAKSRGYKDTTAVWTLSLLGLMAVPSVVCFGALTMLMRRRTVSGGVVLMASLATIAAAFAIAFESSYKNIGLIILSALIFGFFSVVYRIIQEEVLKEILDNDMVPKVFFFLTWVSGFGYLLGINLGGWLRDRTGDYGTCFLGAAITLGMSGLMLAPLMAFRARNKTIQ